MGYFREERKVILEKNDKEQLTHRSKYFIGP